MVLIFLLAQLLYPHRGRRKILSSFGGRYLNYSVLADDPVAGQHLGILLIELGVGITVAAAMITIFYVFANQDGVE